MKAHMTTETNTRASVNGRANKGVKQIRSAILPLLIGASLGVGGCARSDAYKRDQDYVADDGGGYYNRSKSSPTQRAEALGQPKKRVLVLGFWNDTPVRNTVVGKFSADELRRGLHLTGRMIIPTDATTEMSSEDLVSGERVRVAQVIREGRRLGVAVMIIGRISKIVFRQKGEAVGLLRQKSSIAAVDLELKVFDVQAGREIMAVGKGGEAESSSVVAFEEKNLESPEFRSELTQLAARNAVVKLIPDVVRSIEKLTWGGRVAKVQGTRVYVNAGRSSGLVSGDILKVLTPGEDIYDPATGAFLGRTPGQLKGTLEVIDFLGTDGAICDVHTGANFQEGDSVQLY